MHFSRTNYHNHCINITINNEHIQQVHTTKFLGVTVDSKLTWVPHINNILTKISRPIGVINKIKHFLPASTLTTLYNTLIHPHLTYCNIIWGNTYTSRLKSLLILQKKAIRIITHSNYRAHTAPLFKALHILNITNINLFQTAHFMHKFFTKSLPPIFNPYFTSNNSIHKYYTRQSNHFRLPANYKTLFSRRCIRYHGPLIWNSLPTHIINATSANIFKKSLKLHIVSS